MDAPARQGTLDELARSASSDAPRVDSLGPLPTRDASRSISAGAAASGTSGTAASDAAPTGASATGRPRLREARACHACARATRRRFKIGTHAAAVSQPFCNKREAQRYAALFLLGPGVDVLEVDEQGKLVTREAEGPAPWAK